MKYSSKKLLFALVLLAVALVVGCVAWQLVPPSAQSLRGSAVVVEQTTWQEICIDGKPRLYFSASQGDTALIGVTVSRDSARHHKRVAGCWVNRWALLPSCSGRIATVYCASPSLPKLQGDSVIMARCRQSIATQLKTLKAHKSELDYYLRVHGVQDNGYQSIAALASHVGKVYAEVASASRLLDSLTAGSGHRMQLKTVTEYTAVFRNEADSVVRMPLNVVAASPKSSTMLLQTSDATTPDGATPLSLWTWGTGSVGKICSVGYPGLGEAGLECDTISPVIVPGCRLKDGSHDLARVLISDGSPVFTLKGRFIGIVNGKKINTNNWWN
mgnify:CR=1 FL=1